MLLEGTDVWVGGSARVAGVPFLSHAAVAVGSGQGGAGAASETAGCVSTCSPLPVLGLDQWLRLASKRWKLPHTALMRTGAACHLSPGEGVAQKECNTLGTSMQH